LKKFYTSKYEDIDYFLGRCYLEKSSYSKARSFLETYLKGKNLKFSEEAEYCLKLSNNDLDDITFVPSTIIEHKRNQRFDSYVKAAKDLQSTEEKVAQSDTYTHIKDALSDNEKIFDYNVLDLYCGTGSTTYLLRKNKMLHFVLGVDISKYMLDYCKKLSIGTQELYNSLINKNVTHFIASKAKSTSKFDIILAESLIAYTSDVRSLFENIKAYIQKDGILVFDFHANSQKSNCLLNIKLEEFIYNAQHVTQEIEAAGWHVLTQDEVLLKKQEHKEITMVLKLKETHG
jgi:SAM-dependent methyltransferase